jgi:hypothetical protein
MLGQKGSWYAGEQARRGPAHLLEMPCLGPPLSGLHQPRPLQKLLELRAYFSELFAEKKAIALLSAYQQF